MRKKEDTNLCFSTLKRLFSVLNLLFLASVLLTACSTEDDVIDIFTGKTWKLARLTDEGSKAQFYQGLWQSNEEMMASVERLYEQPATFTITFEGGSINGELTSTGVRGQGVSASFTGTWTANPKTQDLSISLKVNGAEGDPLARAFISALQKVYKYEGSNNTLSLYYKEGERTRLIGLTPQR